jgi:hypothetical protein
MSGEAVGLVMVCAAVVLACRMLRVPATLPLLVVVLGLMQLGALQAAAVPGLAQLATVKTDLESWTEERKQAAIEAVRQARAYSDLLEGEVAETPARPPAPPAGW